MKYQAVLFDLDGTLLPMDLDVFTKTYFGLLSRRFSEYPQQEFIAAVWAGSKAMMTNDGAMTNEQRFWSVFSGLLGESVLGRDEEFEDFYRTDFHKARAVCGENPLAKAVVDLARTQAEQVILATNPLFPPCAVESRLSWIGLRPSDFDHITTYDNSSFCKPSADYYRQILHNCALEPQKCLMVGNDLLEDGRGASQVGIATHMVTDCLVTHGLDPQDYSCSSFGELPEFLR